MPLMTFTQQVVSHLEFLRDLGLDVEELAVDAGIVRCQPINPESGKFSEYAYRTSMNPMAKAGMVGLVTWCRGAGGREETHKTYGLGGSVKEYTLKAPLARKTTPKSPSSNEDVSNKCRWMWEEASKSGSSEYLKRKGVGSYGIRFNEHGAAIVPACDRSGILWAVQFLNSNGLKRFPEGSAIGGLFHELRRPVNGQILGVSESYVTAATCMEISGVPTICAFSSGNLVSVVKTMREKYPDSKIVIFADNDRHLPENKGVLFAKKAAVAVNSAIVAIPDFGEAPFGRDASDWNDLFLLLGKDLVNQQIGSIMTL